MIPRKGGLSVCTTEVWLLCRHVNMSARYIAASKMDRTPWMIVELRCAEAECVGVPQVYLPQGS